MALYSGRSIVFGVATITTTLRIFDSVISFETRKPLADRWRHVEKRRGGNGFSGIALTARQEYY